MLMENILKDLASKRTPVRIYTTNGYQMHVPSFNLMTALSCWCLTVPAS